MQLPCRISGKTADCTVFLIFFKLHHNAVALLPLLSTPTVLTSPRVSLTLPFVVDPPLWACLTLVLLTPRVLLTPFMSFTPRVSLIPRA